MTTTMPLANQLQIEFAVHSIDLDMSWDDAAEQLPKIVADFLTIRFPHACRKKLDELAGLAVVSSDSRVSVEFGNIAPALALSHDAQQ